MKYFKLLFGPDGAIHLITLIRAAAASKPGEVFGEITGPEWATINLAMRPFVKKVVRAFNLR